MNREIKRFGRSLGDPQRLVNPVIEEIRRRVEKAYDQPEGHTDAGIITPEQTVTSSEVVIYEDGEKESREAQAREARQRIVEIRGKMPPVNMPS